ncbi:TatA/E family twin arginine-targeting protein translocase [Waterburya agarophytonicola K14]|uniref:Sec-independent protein translocase protein TatA n=1 Tax=Waterburya agarophytonicola KI4 TaxID=2874699 RepID=A0A964BNI8_9CYAN|nr:TatA/E family twin arginine-targeting protein translocase [Waterburya agarophytonicola]MCC0175613.1 TatA/E family twin arginine-targeting protein translocase [Waterburya agarophytonicola KI4]
MNIFGIGLPEMALITIVALLVFGPKKLPEIGRSVAKTLRSFQDASKEFENEFKKEAQKIEESVTMNAKLEAAGDSKTSEQTDISATTESSKVVD